VTILVTDMDSEPKGPLAGHGKRALAFGQRGGVSSATVHRSVAQSIFGELPPVAWPAAALSAGLDLVRIIHRIGGVVELDWLTEELADEICRTAR